MTRHFVSSLVVLVCLQVSLATSSYAQSYELILSNEDTAFSVKGGGWELDKTGTYYHSFRFSAPGPGLGAALGIWTIDAIPPGQYTVEFYVDNGNHAANAEYVVESDAGITTLTRSQNYVGLGWHPLGTFSFTNAGRITQTDHWTGAGTKVIADTLRLQFVGTPTVPTLNVVRPAISICIDDLGALNPNDAGSYTYQLFQQAPEFTYAVMPSQPYGAAVLQWAQSLGIETILHQPMQYVGQPDTNPSDTTRLYVGMTDTQILTTFRNNLDPMNSYVNGVNNHQGSRFSQYAHGLDICMDELADRQYYFCDSRTIADSAAYDRAKAAGLLAAERDLFIDGNTAQATVDYVMELATRAIYSPNYSHMGIGHQRTYTVPGLFQALTQLQAAGVDVRRVSRNAAVIVESDWQPAGSSFTVDGPWLETDSDMISHECEDGASHYLTGTTPGWARFTPSLPIEGRYLVFVGYAPGTDNCSAAKVSTHAANGDQVFVLDQTMDPNRWHYLGAFPFAAGTNGYVQIDNSLCTSPSEQTRADCVKFVYDGVASTGVTNWALYD